MDTKGKCTNTQLPSPRPSKGHMPALRSWKAGGRRPPVMPGLRTFAHVDRDGECVWSPNFEAQSSRRVASQKARSSEKPEACQVALVKATACPSLCYFFETRHTTLPTSSETSTEPSLATATPTGRPSTSFWCGLGSKPVRKLSGLALGSPFSKGTKITS